MSFLYLFHVIILLYIIFVRRSTFYLKHLFPITVYATISILLMEIKPLITL